MTKLLKVHGSGNDFFLLDQTLLSRQISETELKELAQHLCDRKKGLHGGADGLLLVTESDDQAQAKMRVINADGSEASMCGNGIRTVARYVARKNHLSTASSFLIETMYADLRVKSAPSLANNVPAFDAEISPVSFAAEKIGMHIGKSRLLDEIVPEISSYLHFSAVAVPNPHLISFVDQKKLQGDTLPEIAAYLNGENPYFPNGVNVSFVNVLSENQIFVRTYERGVGLTNACGTAMSASSLIYVIQTLGRAGLERELKVYNPGGMVKTVVHQRENGKYWISLIGNATITASVDLDISSALKSQFTGAKWKETNEGQAYDCFASLIRSQIKQ